MTTLSIPSTSALPSSHLLPSTHPLIKKTLQKLPRPALLSLALDWLDDANYENCPPYLSSHDEDEHFDDAYPPAQSLEELREAYTELQKYKGTKREVLERILEGDWRDGISLYQLAMADMQFLLSHPTSLRWTAFKICRLGEGGEGEMEGQREGVPRFHPATFLRNLQAEGLPDVKAHYNLDRHPTLPLLILRILVVESPYVTPLALSSNAKTSTLYIAFPDSAPFVYLSLPSASGAAISSGGEKKSVQRLLVEAIPKAFSKPRERYRLEATSLNTRNLEALCQKRGGGRENAAAGPWSGFASTASKDTERDNPLNTHLPTPPVEDIEDEDADELGDSTPALKREGGGMKRKREDDSVITKKRNSLAKARFGISAKLGDGKGIERLDIRIQDPFPSTATDPISGDGMEDNEGDDEEWSPDIRVSFVGTHVFAGIRRLVEEGVVDGRGMPGWMTGEEGISVGVVRDGRIIGHKGSGI